MKFNSSKFSPENRLFNTQKETSFPYSKKIHLQNWKNSLVLVSGNLRMCLKGFKNFQFFQRVLRPTKWGNLHLGVPPRWSWMVQMMILNPRDSVPFVHHLTHEKMKETMAHGPPCKGFFKVPLPTFFWAEIPSM